MIYQLRRAIPKRLQPHLIPVYRRVRRRLKNLDRAFDKRTMSEAEFDELLGELGVNRGATVLVHSSMDEIARRLPALTPLAIIELLKRRLGEDGTLLMPTFPFLGLQTDYASTHATFNVSKTPSQVGLITEVFRRMPDVRRSLHPTHSIAGWGKRAAELLGEHHLGTAFGPNSPIYKLHQYDGQVIGLGTGLSDSLTILHVPEELDPRTREYVYEKEPRTMTIVSGADRVPYELFAMRRGLDRNYARVEKILLRDGTLRYVYRKGLRCAVTRAAQFIRRSLELIERGQYLFEGQK